MSAQLELIPAPPANHQHWRESLARWPREAFHWRHARNTTGWSMVRQDFLFAELLFRAGEMDKATFRRWFRLERRVRRWDQYPESFPRVV